MRSNFWGVNADGSLDVAPGCEIGHTIREAILRCFKSLKSTTVFSFNGVKVRVRYNSNPELIYRDWMRALNGFTSNDVGPYPKKKLARAEVESDKRISDENDRQWAAKQAEYDAKMKAKADKVAARLSSAGPIELSDVDAWEAWKAANADGYGAAVMTYAERWARLMQADLADGQTLADVAGDASHNADLEGITGFMYGCAVSMLSKCWKHGEDLRRWHNIVTQIGNEGEQANESGGVLNPALLKVA